MCVVIFYHPPSHFLQRQHWIHTFFNRWISWDSMESNEALDRKGDIESDRWVMKLNEKKKNGNLPTPSWINFHKIMRDRSLQNSIPHLTNPQMIIFVYLHQFTPGSVFIWSQSKQHPRRATTTNTSIKENSNPTHLSIINPVDRPNEAGGNIECAHDDENGRCCLPRHGCILSLWELQGMLLQ